MTKNLLILSLVFLAISTVYSTTNIPCFCPMVYFPVCSYNGQEFSTFSNECFGHCANYTMVYAGECKTNNTLQSLDCLDQCGKNLSWVCARKENDTVSVPSPCFAKCQGLSIIRNGTCKNKRVLGVASWMSGVVNSISNAINKTDQAIVNAANKTAQAVATAVNKTEQVVDSAANKTAQALINAANKTGQAIVNAVNKTEQALDNAVNKTEQALDNAGQAIKNAINTVVSILTQRIRKAEEDFENCTCHVVDKVEDAVEQQLDDWEAKAKADAALLKNKTEAFWDQTKDGFIAVEEKVAGWFDKTAEGIANETILIWALTRDSIQKDVNWFKNVILCSNCTNDYNPVCVHCETGDQATFLNQCWANCGGLPIMYAGKCMRMNDTDGGEAFIVSDV